MHGKDFIMKNKRCVRVGCSAELSVALERKAFIKRDATEGILISVVAFYCGYCY